MSFMITASARFCSELKFPISRITLAAVLCGKSSAFNESGETDNLSSHERSLPSTPIYQAEVTAAHVHNLRLCFWRDARYPPVLPALDPDHGEVQLIVPPKFAIANSPVL